MVYDAALQPALWEPTLEGIHQAFDAAGGGLVMAGPGDRFIRVSNVDPESTQSYNAHYGRLDYVLAAVEAGGVGEVRTGDELIAPRVDSEFHTDWVRKTGTEDGLFVRLTPGDNPATLALISPRRSTPFGSTEQIHALRLLVPHLQQAIAAQRTLAHTAILDAELSATLALMTHGALVVDPGCTIGRLNSAAQALLRDNDGLAVTAGGRLVAQWQAANGALTRAVRRAIPRAGDEPISGTTLLCRRPSGRRSYLVHVVPLGDPERAPDSPERNALVLVVDPERLPDPPSSMLRKIFGLTRTEADIAVRLSRAEELRTIASDLEVSMTTIRTHLQHIFVKTDTHRQAELVRLLSNLSR